MKKKNILLLFILVLLMVPSLTNAITEEEAKQKAQEELDRMIASETTDGNCVWDIKTIDFSIIQNNTCNYTKEEVLKMYPGWSNLSPEELETQMQDLIHSCQYTAIYSIIENASVSKGNAAWAMSFDINSIADGKMTLRSYYDFETENGTGSAQVEKTCSINFLEANEAILQDANQVTKKFAETYALYGLNTFNSIYHYGPIVEAIFTTDSTLYRFPEFKKVIMNNSDYTYKIVWDGAGSTPAETGCGGYVLLYKDDIPYAMKYVNFVLYNEFYVDKDAEGTTLEKAEKRLREYFKGNVYIEIDKENYTYFDEEEFNGYLTTIKIGNYKDQILVKEVDGKELDKYTVHAYHQQTGVNVDSDSYEVSIDATLDAEQTKDKDHVKKAFKEGKFKLLDAYDISVIKTGDGSTINTIENGIEVYIPIKNKKVGDKIKVHHVADDGELGDEFEGKVVEKDGKLYVHFTTTHFSTYAISEVTTTDVKNPDTFDNITTSLLVGTIAIVSLLSVSFIFVKKNENLK